VQNLRPVRKSIDAALRYAENGDRSYLRRLDKQGRKLERAQRRLMRNLENQFEEAAQA
jgi:hypothetical protein